MHESVGVCLPDRHVRGRKEGTCHECQYTHDGRCDVPVASTVPLCTDELAAPFVDSPPAFIAGMASSHIVPTSSHMAAVHNRLPPSTQCLPRYIPGQCMRKRDSRANAFRMQICLLLSVFFTGAVQTPLLRIFTIGSMVLGFPSEITKV